MGRGGGEGSEEREREREWEEAAEAVAYDSCTWPPPVVAVCGPGNSGKSAFSRLLLNTLVGRYKKVAYLDTDVGQPEFTPPGFVSIHVLEEQAEDFKMLYLRTPKRCFFFGDCSAKKNPKLLLSYIFSLYDYFLKELYRFEDTDNPNKSAIPLVINTSGWVKGTGLHMLTEMLKYASPTHVIRLRTSVEGKNLPAGMFWLDEPEGDPAINLVEIRAAQHSPRHLLVKKEARIIRDLRIIAYFRQCLPMEFPVFSYNDLIQGFASIEPFQLPLSKLQVIDLHSQVSDYTVHHFLKGTIVGIATSASVPLSNQCSTPCCIGLGFIKAIDVSRDCIHLITPVSRQLLENADIFFRSSFTVPTCLLQVVSDTASDIADRLRELNCHG
ncbi:polynucleotide 5'-hydroxyl-kinase NOL9-like isoform X1 [Oryza glaberrima]|uniref:polynucleotide 5'-hydroxyl-kinase NOL9-like isoform X1 n=1 Tax=Oryza glaberrima TaxID=4538 RepID=UPI00224C064C|nr:polynucleotide 5'-hydroxyl-kinase NOL9-like isoform X1 [Oryza glaberrima]